MTNWNDAILNICIAVCVVAFFYFSWRGDRDEINGRGPPRDRG